MRDPREFARHRDTFTVFHDRYVPLRHASLPRGGDLSSVPKDADETRALDPFSILVRVLPRVPLFLPLSRSISSDKSRRTR